MIENLFDDVFSRTSDDRSEYASVKAILYGPYLLAGLSNSDWDIKTGSSASFSDWIRPVPSTYNFHLISIAQEFNIETFVVSNSNHSIITENFRSAGTDSAVNATFRLNINHANGENIAEPKHAIGNSVMLDPFNLPGMVVMHQGVNKTL